MTTDLVDIRRELVASRSALNFAWTTWAAMKPPKSVMLRARVVWGEDWLAIHTGVEEQERGRNLLAELRAQAHNAELEEAEPGPARNLRGAWDMAEKRFMEAEREYLRLVSDAAKRGIPEPEDGE